MPPVSGNIHRRGLAKTRNNSITDKMDGSECRPSRWPPTATAPSPPGVMQILLDCSPEYCRRKGVARTVLSQREVTSVELTRVCHIHVSLSYRRQTRAATRCVTCIVLYTNVDAHHCKLVTDDRRQFITLSECPPTLTTLVTDGRRAVANFFWSPRLANKQKISRTISPFGGVRCSSLTKLGMVIVEVRTILARSAPFSGETMNAKAF